MGVGGGCLPQCMLGYTPQEQTPPGADTSLGADTPWEQTPLGADPTWEQTPSWSRHPREQTPPLGADPPKQTPPAADTPQEQTPPWAAPPGSRLQHTVNERPVRILLECILIMNEFMRIQNVSKNFLQDSHPFLLNQKFCLNLSFCECFVRIPHLQLKRKQSDTYKCQYFCTF